MIVLGVVVHFNQIQLKFLDHQRDLDTVLNLVSHKVVVLHSNVQKPVIGVVIFDMLLVMLIFKMEPHSFNFALTNV